ncbi:MAG: AAA family ATPase, partial [Pseudomonadales bacterium]|nr:AAA family ATPase [Pseudomonadales bacterium]
DAERVLQKPFAWEALKRALNDHRVRIESVSQLLNMTYSVSLEPQAMPLNVKVILLGSRELYHLLRHYDPDFGELFKVVADFADRVPRTDDNIVAYVSLIANIVKETGISHLDHTAVERVLEYCSREVEDREHLSTHVSEIRDLLLEADYLAKASPEHLITSQDVTDALNKRTYRLHRFRELIQENISNGVIRVETRGTKVGQINGLAIVNIGQINFGQPARITATTRLGRGQVVDIERESNLGGDIHSKAVLIVASYIGSRYARDFTLSLSASLVFEQSYSSVDGDSASIAEVCALISAIAQLPARQTIAITGSMDQHGGAQAIGGVNQKIEGFYSVCKQQGLNGSHGVIIPAANKHHLMLEAEVIDAVDQGKFHIYTINNVDEALQIMLTKDDQPIPLADIDEAVITQLKEFDRIAHPDQKKAYVDDTKATS